MSADRWIICPRCEKNRGKGMPKYGTVPEAEYLAALAEAKKPMESTLREDWEIGLTGEWFEMSYSAHCHVCGFSSDVKFEKKVDI